MGKIEHVIIIVKENHGFDNYFGTFPGADGQAMPHSQNPPPQDPDHRHPAWMHRDTVAIRAQFTEKDIPAYFEYARQFTLCDRYFTDIAGPSSPNHLMLIAGDSPIIANPPRYRLPQGTGTFDIPSLPARLDQAGKTWRNYNGYAFDFITGLRGRNKFLPGQFASDAAAGDLPTVSWVYAPHSQSEHPADPGESQKDPLIGNVTHGMQWTVKQVEAVVRGGLWPKCAIFITWDDWGGWYDHVVPPLVERWQSTTEHPEFNGEQFRYGGRVPCLVLSPYAKSGYISHAQHSHVSLLKFVEQQFGLQPVNTRTTAADAMDDCFDFQRQPAKPPALNLAAMRAAASQAAPRARWASGRVLNVAYRPGSTAANAYRSVVALPSAKARVGRLQQAAVLAAALPPGVPPIPEEDLVFQGGKTIPSLIFTNFYVGRQAWNPADIQRIDDALAKAMTDRRLNNVMAQYFPGQPVTSAFRPSAAPATFDTPAPAVVSQGDVEAMVADLHGQGLLVGFDFGSTVFNLMLPPGTVLNSDTQPTTAEQKLAAPGVPAVPESAAALIDKDEPGDSEDGLGGYHGSIHVAGPAGADTIIYYAVGVFSEDRNGHPNGIPVFDASWKNVVATFYHELCEARTDPDVEDAIRSNSNSFAGWISASGQECGDFPIQELSELNLPNNTIFQEVELADGSGTVPIQLQWSNAVHGPEGPIDQPH
jgi:phospholipase C